MLKPVDPLKTMGQRIAEKRLRVKNRLREGKPVFVGWTSFGHPGITEIFARSGVDLVGIDLEHSTIDQEQAQRIIAACQAEGTLCYPRVASHNREMIARILDSGADGLIVPMVSTPEQVADLISWMKYPPMGSRSYGIARGQGYGFDFESYTRVWNEHSSLIIQIESVEAIENLDAMLEFDEVDGAMVGPYDLSGSLGVAGDLTHPSLLDAIAQVKKACDRHGKACGNHLIHPTPEQIEKAVEDGYGWIVLSSDVFLLWDWSAQINGMLSDGGWKN